MLNNRIASFLQYLKEEKNYSDKTIIAYKEDLNSIFLFFEKTTKINDEFFLKLDYKNIREWLFYRDNLDISPRSNARAISALKSFYTFLKRKFNMINLEIIEIKSPKFKKSLPRNVEVNNFLKIIELIKETETEEWEIYRDIALLTLIFGSGVRISEALNINYRDIHQKDFIKIIGKGKKERIIPIIKPIQETLDKYTETCPYPIKKSDFLFHSKTGLKYNATTFQKLIKNIRVMLGLPDSVTPHAFRHSFATELLNNGVDLRSIQELLGHKDLSSTEIYTNVNYKKILESYEDCFNKK